MSRSVFIAGKILIFLDYLDSPDSGVVAACFDYVVIPYFSLSYIVSAHLTGSIVGVSLLYKCNFAPESTIAELLLEV